MSMVALPAVGSGASALARVPGTRLQGPRVPCAGDWVSVGPATASGRGLVSRRRLFDALDRAITGRVTVVSAPPGGGKTMLLCSWLEQADLARRTAWVSVDRGEHDAQGFWISVAGQLRAATGSEALAQMPTPSPQSDGSAAIEGLLSALSSLDEPVVLVIDDLHELRSASALAQLGLLLTRMPPVMHIVLATRRDPQLGLGRLRLAGELTEIRAAHLRFTLSEARELLAAAGIVLPEDDLAVLHDKTEGWVAGLRLAAMALAGHPEPERFVAEFSGSERTVADYLLTEALDRQPEDVRTLLLRTSVLDRVSGPLADFMAGGSGSERMLQTLEEENAFVASLDAGRSWFRYHHLFADLLRLELRRHDAGLATQLHLAAARWLAEHGQILGAVKHAQAAGDWPQAARLLADHFLGLHLSGQGATIPALLAAFPAGTVPADAELAGVFAADQLTRGSLEEAAAYLDLAERMAATVPQHRRGRFERLLANRRLSLARRRGDVAAALETARALQPLPAQTPGDIELRNDLQALALMNLGIAELWSGRVTDAESHLEQGAELARRIGRRYLEMGCLAHLGPAAQLRSLTSARQRCEQAIALAEAHGWQSEPFIAVALVTLGAIEAWAGRFDEAQNWLDRAPHAMRPEAEPATTLLFHWANGLLHAGQGRHEQALREFQAAGQRRALFVPPQMLTTQMRGLLLQTQARLGATAAVRAGLAELGEEDRRWGESLAALAAAELADGNPHAAVEALAPVLDGSAPVTHVSSAVQAVLLDAIAHDRLGDAASAAADIERALGLAEPDGLILPFALAGAGELLERHPRQRTGHAALLANIRTVLAGSSPPPRPGEPAVAAEALSGAELRVLRYLPSNLSRPEISAELFVSPNTIETHMRHIYAKLGVHRRSEAVQRARQLGLLAPAARPR
jgi:LuxR family transcriptional regulator, maltose regulon positive regulatory protein